ncbi:MAG: hypothetical protein JW993_10150 [Sedimentisphaerales bacterium]|nr:hypothetical protein [Sedimentisphaerales bacterium]
MRDRLVRRIVAACAVLIAVLLCEALLANAMLKPVSRDEHMYCTAAVLLGQGRQIYRDFSYPAQLPYHPLLLAGIYRVFDTRHYLLAGRLVSVACDILVVVLILVTYHRVFGAYRLEGLLFGLAAAVFYVFNPQVDDAAGRAWNHDAVILCVMLAFWLFTAVDFQGKGHVWRVAVIGALLTFATCMRVTTALVEVLFLGVILVGAGGSVRNRVRAALPFSLAGLAIAAWPVWVCLQAPQAVWLNLVRLPVLYGRWLHQIGMTQPKLTLTLFCLTKPEYLVLLAVSGYLLWTSVRRWRHLEPMTRRDLVAACLLAGAFSLIAFIPPTMWEQYWAAPVPFLTVALAWPLANLCRSCRQDKIGRDFRVATWVVFIGATVTAFANPAVLHRLRDATATQAWTPLALHQTSVDIVARTPEPKRVLTLGPLYALEGGAAIYPELASGSVVYRVADALTERERAVTHTVGPAALVPLVEQHPPAAIVAGVEQRGVAVLEEPLLEATGPDWRVETYADGIRAYFRP